jgi:hypothetical protein
MATTFVKIASATAGSGGSASFDFTSIPSTYTDLCIKMSTRGSGGDTYGTILFNGSSSNFTSRRIDGDGSNAASASRTDNLIAITNQSTQTANTFSNSEIYIPNYAGGANKSFSYEFVNENNATFATSGMWALLWSNTSAISSISLVSGNPTFVQYSTATLYGISKS